MTRISRKLISWLLGALACMAIVFGIVIARPQAKTAAAADTAVTFSSLSIEGIYEGQEQYGNAYLFKTSSLQWETYHNWVAASDWASISDYTTVNGRTVTEINNATTNSQKITLMMQPVGSYSFLRLYIPEEVIAKADVKSMGILDGWSFNNGTNNYTASAVSFFRTGDTMLEESAYIAAGKTVFTSSNITIGDASLSHRVHSDRGADSYIVDINIGQTIGEYDAMYSNYKYLRNAIYINGKSIEEWNAQKIAENARFNDPSTYTYFPQNSTDPTHLDTFVKPVGLWGTSTGFRLSIFQELVADCEEIVVTIGEGAYVSGNFMLVETISKTVFTQSVVDITDKLTFLDNSVHNPADWGETKLYFIHTNNEAYWTQAPKGGCLNESDPSIAGGGQIQMKYITFNGSTLWDINKNDDGAYGSTQGNIASGGVYAPILVTMSSELGSSLKLTVPTAYTNGKDGHEEIVIKKGFCIYENGVSYYVTNDVVFTNNDTTAWKKEVKGIELATEVTGIITKANRTDGATNENFVIFQLSNNDYTGCDTTAITDISSIYGYIDIGGTVVTTKPGEPYFNVWKIANSVAFRAPGLDATGLQNVPYITIKAGAKFPSYNTQYNGDPLTYYVTSEDITFVHDVPNDTWTVGTQSTAEYTVTFTVDGSTYTTQSVTSGNAASEPTAPTKAEDANYTYTFDGWYLDGNKYDFSAAITSDITLTAQFTATPKANTVDITNELTCHSQGQFSAGTETYMIKTPNAYWTKNPQGGCLNEYDAEGAGGGQEQMKYIYFNGTSLYNINKNDDDSYNAEQSNIASGGIYAPILVTMGLDGTYSYIQIHVPTEYPNLGGTANQNHQSIEIKAGFSVTEGSTTWSTSKDVKWLNLNGTWVNVDDTFAASTVTIDNPRIEGDAKELYKVDITSQSWTIDCNHFDFMYGNAYDTYRQYIYINGVSVYDINANTDDSGYTYSTSPMNSTADGHPELFAHPVLIYTEAEGEVNSNTLTLWIHKNYIESLGDDITITLGAGYNAFTNGLSLAENVNYSMIANVTVDNGTKIISDKIIKGNTISGLFGTPTKEMTETTIYTFEGWYVANTDTVYDPTTPITEDISVEARFTEETVKLIETEVVGITHYLKISDDNWLAFELSEHDYANAAGNYNMGGYTELLRIGFLDKVILKGSIVLNSGTVSEATLMDVYKSYGPLEGPLLNFWSLEQFGIRVPVGNGVTEIVIQEGCFFPSYAYVSGGTIEDTRYAIMREATYKYDENMGVFVKQAAVEVDIQMEAGASVRVTSDMTTSGIRFQTNIAKADLETLQAAVAEGENQKYTKVEFGTLIVPTDYLMGGSFTHDWLINNGLDYLDIVSTVEIEDLTTFPVKGETYYSYFGSIVKLKETNYGRTFSGLGYIKLTDLEEKEIYIYAQYDAANKRSASFVANAAINDRQDSKDDEYKHLTENDNYSPYTYDERTFLEGYIVWSNSAINSDDLGILEKGASKEIAPTTQKLAGAYVKLIYSTEVNLWGVFTYTDGDKTASEDFYLQAGTTEHKQYLDIFRYNGVGYGMDTSNLSMTSITLTNAELEAKSGSVKVYGLYSEDKTIDTANQEIYLTVAQDDSSEMTVGAHLGIGGALTYLAKSGVYEGVIGGSSSWKNGTVAISTDKSVFDSKNVYKSGSSSSSTSTEAGYYGSATGSKPSDGAVNLINNFDAGRQIQQSWYAEVGGSDTATDGSNGYNRAYCYTGSTKGQYWPYNPVQAGDVVSNPGQIVDYEINTTKGYIYVKARAMDWAKGYDASRPCENAVEGGVTTKSYVENYYRLNTDGTLVVNNGFVDWNGFTDMASCDWASTELPAVYPVHTLNYYVSNIDGDGSWTDAIEYNSSLSSWTVSPYHQFASAANGLTKVEDWFAWANGGDGNAFGMGIYIPNVTRYTSGRSNSSTAYYTDTNFQNSNALPVDNYSEFSWSSLKNVDMVTDFAERGNILADKDMMSNMQSIQYTYQSAYVSNTSYTAPGIDFRMEAYVPIEYSYVICLNTVDTIRETFYSIMENGTVTNAGNAYEKVGLDAWARADKKWTW